MSAFRLHNDVISALKPMIEQAYLGRRKDKELLQPLGLHADAHGCVTTTVESSEKLKEDEPDKRKRGRPQGRPDTANYKIRKYLISCFDNGTEMDRITSKDIAEALGYQDGTIRGCPAWRDFNKMREAERKSRENNKLAENFSSTELQQAFHAFSKK